MRDASLEHWFQKLETGGEIIPNTDGYYVYWPSSKGGCLNTRVLRALADYLEEKNATWDAEVIRAFEQKTTE